MKRFLFLLVLNCAVYFGLRSIALAQSVNITLNTPPTLIEVPVQLSGISGSPVVALGVSNSLEQSIPGAPIQCFPAPTNASQTLYAVYNTDSWPADTYSITASVWNISLDACNRHAFRNFIAGSQPVYYTIGGENIYSAATPSCATCGSDLTAIYATGAQECLTNPMSGVCEVADMQDPGNPNATEGNLLALNTLCVNLPAGVCN